MVNLAADEKFRVPILVGPLIGKTKRKGWATGPGWKPAELFGLEGSTPSPSAQDNMVSVVYAVGTPACEAGGEGSTPFGHP